LTSIRILEETSVPYNRTMVFGGQIAAYFMSVARKAQALLTKQALLEYDEDDSDEDEDEDADVEAGHGQIRSVTEVVLLRLDGIASNVSNVSTRIEDYDESSPWGVSEPRVWKVVPYTKLINILPRLKSFELDLTRYSNEGRSFGQYLGSILAQASNLKSLRLSTTLDFRYVLSEL
jgi:hypothetical protein